MKNFSGGRSSGFGGRRRNFGSQPRRFGGQNRFRSKGPGLNPMMFVVKAQDVVEEVYTPTNLFVDFDLDERVKQNIQKNGYEKPTPIQDQAIKHIIDGRDLVGLANTGTGKTAAFLLPLVSKVVKNKNEQVLIVTPTRELAAQIRDEFRKFSEGTGVYASLCIGGASMNSQIMELRRRPHFVIGTPGRIKDLEKRRILSLKSFANVVLDEVDRMLDMGFVHDIREIISKLSENRQSLFFSATMPDEIKRIMSEFLRDPMTVSVKKGSTSANVDQDIIRVNGRDKVEILHELLQKEEFKKVLVFGRTKWGVEKLEMSLQKRGLKAAAIHGNKSQGQRMQAIRKLKSGEIQALLATDVASRGLDIDNVTHVINYEVPERYEDYVHRIGRTGRAGKKGVALTFVD